MKPFARLAISIILVLGLILSWIALALGVGGLLDTIHTKSLPKLFLILGLGISSNITCAYLIAVLVSEKKKWLAFFALVFPGVLTIIVLFSNKSAPEYASLFALLVSGIVSLCAVNFSRIFLRNK